MCLLKETYKNKKVLITGDTGFKGSWLAVWLLEIGAEVYGISKDIPTRPSHFEAAELSDKVQNIKLDIRDLEGLCREVKRIKPDYVFHLAAQPLVRLSYQEPITTIQSNVLGTANLLEALRLADCCCSAVFITSDKCYENVEWEWGYREIDKLGGKDPYSASKGAAELIIKTYVHSFFQSEDNPVKVAVGRAGNVIGGGDWGQDRLIPDCAVAWSQKKRVEVRNPAATRPWQHVLEPLSGYLSLGAALSTRNELNGEAFNFGPPAEQNYSVQGVIQLMNKYWKNVSWKDVSIQQNSLYEAGLLKLCCDKALHTIQWKAVLDFEQTVRMTVEWYRNYYENSDARIYEFTRRQIQEYQEVARERQLAWAL